MTERPPVIRVWSTNLSRLWRDHPICPSLTCPPGLTGGEELGVRMIYAYSPQAKGRIERKFGVFPRLWRGSELRLHNISTKEEANRYLTEKFIPRHNRMFSSPAKEGSSAYRPLPKGLVLKDIFCLKEERMVAGDNTISYQGKTFQILPNEYAYALIRAGQATVRPRSRYMNICMAPSTSSTKAKG